MYSHTSSSVKFEGKTRRCSFGFIEVQRRTARPLVLWVPPAEGVPHADDALLGARGLFVASRAAEERVEAVVLHRVEQRHGLEAVARRAGARLLDDAAGLDRVLDARDDEALAELGRAGVPEREDLGEVVPRVDVEEREGEARGAERLLGEPEHHDRVLAAAEEQGRALALGDGLPEDRDGLVFEVREVGVELLGTCHGEDAAFRPGWSFGRMNNLANRSRTL